MKIYTCNIPIWLLFSVFLLLLLLLIFFYFFLSRCQVDQHVFFPTHWIHTFTSTSKFMLHLCVVDVFDDIHIFAPKIRTLSIIISVNRPDTNDGAMWMDGLTLDDTSTIWPYEWTLKNEHLNERTQGRLIIFNFYCLVII